MRKHKFFARALYAVMALALVAGSIMVPATPVAANVTGVTATPSPDEIDTVGEYAIDFNSPSQLVSGDQVMITFPSDTTVPSSYETLDVTIDMVSVAAGNIVGADQTVTITLTTTIAPGSVAVVFKEAAGVVNPTTPGAYKLTVSTTKDPTPVESGAYDIIATPTITDVTPSTGLQEAIQAETITGTNFVEGAAVSFEAKIDVTETTVVSLTQITCTITIGSDADAGPRNVTVTTVGGIATLEKGFTVVGVPSITEVKPPKANQGDTEDVDIIGGNFAGVTSVGFGPGITVSDVTEVSLTKITCTIAIDVGAAVGPRNVTVTTPAGPTELEAFEVQLLGTPLVDVYDSTGGYLDQKDNINDAIAVTNAATLMAHAATYVEGVTINKSITLQSLSGKATTIIDSPGETTGIDITAAGVTVDGFTVDGPVAGFGITIAADGVTIQNNTIDSAGTSITATTQVDNAHILDNLISNTGQGIHMGLGALGWRIEDNQIGGGLGEIKPAGIVMPGGAIDAPTQGNIIKGNTISDDISCGIHLRDEGYLYFFGNVIEGNTISDASSYGIVTDDDLNFWGLVIIKNDISGSWEDGIGIRSWTADAGNVINYNDIYGNGLMSLSEGHEWWGGIKNKSGVLVDARYNWWGEEGGPSTNTHTNYACTALGNGDAVSKLVTYDPWLTKLQATVISDGIRWYGSDAITLQAGWNTLSVPVHLKGDADTFGEIAALGSFLDPLVGTSYWYEACPPTPLPPDWVPHWVPVDTDTQLVPGMGFYVQMDADTRFPVLYNGTMGPMPSYDMCEGWNLIGSMFGVDKADGSASPEDVKDYGIASLDVNPADVNPITGEDPESCMDKDAALNSISAGASVVVSPSMPGQLIAWSEVYDGTAPAAGALMLVGEAYWVFMTADGTLAGFEITPFFFVYA